MGTTLWVTAQHEIRRALRQRTYRLAALLIMLLLAVSFVLEVQRQAAERAERTALQTEVSEQWRSQPDRHTHRMAHYGSFAFRPPSELGFFDPGIEPFTGSTLYLEAHRRNTPGFSAASQASELVRFGRPTAAFVLQLLLPLLIFCLTFESVAGERESGTWLLSLSQGVSARTLLLGKALGAVLLVSVLLVPPLLVAFALQALLGDLSLRADVFVRAGLLGALYALYLSFCAALGVLVSALHVRSHAALVTLLSVWVLGWVVVPRVAAETAARIHPVASRAQMEADLARASHQVGNGHGRKSPAAVALTERTLAQYGVSRVEDLPVNINGILMQLGEEQTSAIFDRLYQQLYDTQRAQEQLTLRFGVIAPVLVLRSLSMALAGSDAHQYADFLEQAEAHRAGFIKQLNDLHAKQLHYEENDRLQRASHEHWAGFEPFRYRPPSLAQLSPLARDGAIGLLGWALALALIGMIATRRERAN